MLWSLMAVAHAVAFTAYVRSQGYRGRLWLAAIAALFVGPLIWLWWGYIVMRERSRRVREGRSQLA
jgi:hypothetical protein